MPSVIRAVVGFPRSGKTYYVVRWLYAMRMRHPERPVYSNFPIYLPRGPQVVLYDRLDDLYKVDHAVVVVDEAQTIVNAREWRSHDIDLLGWLSQLGKRHVDLWWTSQDISNVDKWLRGRTFWSYWIESWKAFGFFTFRAYVGCKEQPKKAFRSGMIMFNPIIASCYDHELVL